MPESNATSDMNKITVPESGTYMILYYAKCKWLENSAFGFFILYDDNTQIGTEMYSNALKYSSAGMNCVAVKHLNKDDVIKARVYQFQNGAAGENNLTMNSLKLVRIGD